MYPVSADGRVSYAGPVVRPGPAPAPATVVAPISVSLVRYVSRFDLFFLCQNLRLPEPDV